MGRVQSRVWAAACPFGARYCRSQSAVKVHGTSLIRGTPFPPRHRTSRAAWMIRTRRWTPWECTGPYTHGGSSTRGTFIVVTYVLALVGACLPGIFRPSRGPLIGGQGSRRALAQPERTI